MASPPRLKPSKKLRSSRPYFPSLPAPTAVSGEPGSIISEGDGVAEDMDMGVKNNDDFVDEVDTHHAIEAALNDVWSGLHHDDDDVEEESSDEEEDIEEDPEGWN